MRLLRGVELNHRPPAYEAGELPLLLPRSILLPFLLYMYYNKNFLKSQIFIYGATEWIRTTDLRNMRPML